MARKIDNPQSEERHGAEAKIVNVKDEITLADLDKVTGGETSKAQTLNIGSQSSGSGAGKITFNPF